MLVVLVAALVSFGMASCNNNATEPVVLFLPIQCKQVICLVEIEPRYCLEPPLPTTAFQTPIESYIVPSPQDTENSFLTQRFMIYTAALFALQEDAICITILILMGMFIKNIVGEIIHAVKNNIRRNDDCCICIGTERGEWYQTQCGHNFHRCCISKWHRETCPMCRARIV